MEHAQGVAQAFSRFLAEKTGPQNILHLQRHSVRRWRRSWALSCCSAMLMEARHNKSTTTAANLASCLTALTRAAAAHNGGETILAIKDLSHWGIANAS